jgi:hypothetical protein
VWIPYRTIQIGRAVEVLFRGILAFIGWSGVALGAFIVSKPLLAFVRRPSLRLAATVLKFSSFIIGPAAVLTPLYSTPNPFSGSLLEQTRGMWLLWLALALFGLGEWLEQRTNRVQ